MFKCKQILQFEKKEFAKKYNLKISSLDDDENDYTLFKPSEQKLLKSTRNKYIKSENVVGNSYGFVTIVAFIFVLFVTFVTSFIVFYVLFRR